MCVRERKGGEGERGEGEEWRERPAYTLHACTDIVFLGSRKLSPSSPWRKTQAKTDIDRVYLVGRRVQSLMSNTLRKASNDVAVDIGGR